MQVPPENLPPRRHPPRRAEPARPPDGTHVPGAADGGARRCRGDHGAVSLQLAVVFPALLLTILVTIHAGLYLFSRDLVHSTARVGLDDARTRGSTAADGVARARAYLAQANGSGLLRGVTISSAGSTGTQIRLHVHAIMNGLVPGLPVTLDTDVVGPVERFTTPSSQFTNAEAPNGGN